MNRDPQSCFAPIGVDVPKESTLTLPEIIDQEALALAHSFRSSLAIPLDIASHLSWRFLESKPSRQHAWHRLLDELHPYTPRIIESIIPGVLQRAFLWMADLPASEKYHHAYPFGLLDHTMEVTLGALLTHKRDFEWWRGRSGRSAFCYTVRLLSFLSILHDIGKVFDFEVQAPATGEPWDPLREPLAFFKLRHGQSMLAPTSLRPRPHRGVHGHEEKGRRLVPIIVHRSFKTPIVPHLLCLYEFYTSRNDRPEPSVDAPEERILHCLLEADRESVCAARRQEYGGPEFLDILSKRSIFPPSGTFSK